MKNSYMQPENPFACNVNESHQQNFLSFQIEKKEVRRTRLVHIKAPEKEHSNEQDHYWKLETESVLNDFFISNGTFFFISDQTR